MMPARSMTSNPVLPTRWLVAAIVSCARIGVGFQFISVAALIPELKAELGFDYTEIGILLGTFMVTGIFMSLPSGMISARLGDRRMLQMGLAALVAGGLVMGAGDSFVTAAVGRLMGGLGAVFITVTAARMLTDWFDGKEIASAMSLMGVTWPVGIALGMSVLPLVDADLGWRAAFFATCAMPAMALFLTALLPVASPRSNRAEREIPAPAARPPLWSIGRRELWILMAGSAAWPLMSSGGYVVFSSYAPSLLIEQGVSQTGAGLIISLLSWTIIVTIPLGGYLADRTGKNDRIFWGGCIAAAIAIAMVPLVGPWALWVVLAGVLGLTVGPVMVLPAEILSPNSRSTGIGLYYSIYYLGSGCLPALAGWILTTTGSVTAVIWFSAICLLLAPLPLLALRAMQTRLRREAMASSGLFQ